jgi:hypothetical protein
VVPRSKTILGKGIVVLENHEAVFCTYIRKMIKILVICFALNFPSGNI